MIESAMIIESVFPLSSCSSDQRKNDRNLLLIIQIAMIESAMIIESVFPLSSPALQQRPEKK
jgi:hypothetical protein